MTSRRQRIPSEVVSSLPSNSSVVCIVDGFVMSYLFVLFSECLWVSYSRSSLMKLAFISCKKFNLISRIGCSFYYQSDTLLKKGELEEGRGWRGGGGKMRLALL